MCLRRLQLCRVKCNIFYHMSHHPHSPPRVFVKEYLLLEKPHYSKRRYNRREVRRCSDIELAVRGRRSRLCQAHHFSRNCLRRSQINKHLGRTLALLINLPNAPCDRGPTWNEDLAVHDNIKANLKFHWLPWLRVFLV